MPLLASKAEENQHPLSNSMYVFLFSLYFLMRCCGCFKCNGTFCQEVGHAVKVLEGLEGVSEPVSDKFLESWLVGFLFFCFFLYIIPDFD